MTLLACTNTSCGQEYEREERALTSRPKCPSCGGRLERRENAKLASATAKPHSLRDLIASPVLTSPSRDLGKYIEFACEHCQAISKATKERLGRTAICPKCRQSTTIALPSSLPPRRPSVARDRDGEATVQRDSELEAKKIAAADRQRVAKIEAAKLAEQAAARIRAAEISQRESDARAALEAEQRQQRALAEQAIAEQQRQAEEDQRRAEELRIAQEQQRQRDEAEQQRLAAQAQRKADEAQREESLARERQAAEAEAARREVLERERQAAREKARQKAEVLELQEAEDRLRREARQRAIDAATQVALAASSERKGGPGAIYRRRFDRPLSDVLAEPTGVNLLDVPVSLDLYVRNRYRLLATPGALGNPPSRRRGKSISGDAVTLGYEWHAKPVAPANQVNAPAEHLLCSDLFWLNLSGDAFAAVTGGGKLAYPQSLRTLDDLAQSLAGESLALALHAAAVVAHNQAICMECAYAAGYRVGPELFWDEAFVRWHAVLEHPCFWNCVMSRAAGLSLVVSGESLRLQMSTAILSLNGALAQAYAAAENESACQRHLACMARCRFGGNETGDLVEEITRSIYAY